MTEKGAQEDVKGVGNSGPHGNLTAWGSHLQTGMWLHQFPGATSKITVEKCAILGTAKYCALPSSSQAFYREPETEEYRASREFFPFCI